MYKPIQIEKYGKMVWCNKEMDELRRTECLCLNCIKMPSKLCNIAAQGYNLCVENDIAFMVTRCPNFESNPTK